MDLWFSENHTENVKFSLRVEQQLFSAESEYQRIDVFDSMEFGRVLVVGGDIVLTEREEFVYDEMITHVPMAVHTNPKNILVIGVGDGGVVKELTRYDSVESIDLVEMDPMVVEVCKKYLPNNACQLDNPRVHIHYENGLKFLRRHESEYSWLKDHPLSL